MPALQPVGQRAQGRIGLIGHVARDTPIAGQMLGELFGQHLCQNRCHGFRPRLGAARAQMVEQIDPGTKPDRERITLAPIGRNLQHRRPRKPAMGKQHGLVKGCAVASDAAVHSGSRQCRKDGFLHLVKCQRHERRAGFGDAMAKLRRDLIGQPGGAHLGDGFAARRQNKVSGRDDDLLASPIQPDPKARAVMGHIFGCGFKPKIGA